MHPLRVLICTILFLVIPITKTAAKANLESYGFLWEQFASDTRSASMGRVDLAADGGPFSIWENSAAQHSISSIHAGYLQNQYVPDAKIQGAGVALNTDGGRLRLAWNRAAYVLDGIPVVAPSGDVDGTSYDIHEKVDVLGGSYGFLSRNPVGGSSITMALGGAARIYRSEVSSFKGSAVDFDLGAMVKYSREGERGWFNTRVAIRVRNLLGHSYEVDEDTVYLPHYTNFSLALEGGHNLGWLNDRDVQGLIIYTHRRHLRSHYGNPSDTNHVGAEIVLGESISVRCGATNTTIGGENLSWGMGLSSHRFVESPFVVTVDYGQYNAGKLGGWSNLLTLGASFVW